MLLRWKWSCLCMTSGQGCLYSKRWLSVQLLDTSMSTNTIWFIKGLIFKCIVLLCFTLPKPPENVSFEQQNNQSKPVFAIVGMPQSNWKTKHIWNPIYPISSQNCLKVWHWQRLHSKFRRSLEVSIQTLWALYTRHPYPFGQAQMLCYWTQQLGYEADLKKGILTSPSQRRLASILYSMSQHMRRRSLGEEENNLCPV